MFGGLKSRGSRPARASSPWWAALASIVVLAGCSGNLPDLGAAPGAPSQPASNIGEGKVKAGLILPLSASGNAAVAAQSMRNAAEMALAEFNNPDLQLLVKDDGGGAPGAQQAAQARPQAEKAMRDPPDRDRGALLILVILPNGSRSLIPASWADWRGPHDTAPSSSADDFVQASALGKFGDLLQLRKVIDALQRRHIESASHVESSNAAEPLSRPFRSAVKRHVVEPAEGRLGSTRRERADCCARTAGAPDRSRDRKRGDKGART